MIIGILLITAGMIAFVLNIIYLLKEELSGAKNWFKIIYIALSIISQSTLTYFFLLIIFAGILKIEGVW